MNDASYKRAAQSALEGVFAAAQGRTVDAVRHFVEGGLELVPGEALKRVVDDATIRRANAQLEAEATTRLGPEP